jgi:hypothetical protein
VTNAGSAGIALGLAVTFYLGTPASPGAAIGTARTTVPLLPGAGAWVEQPFVPSAGDAGPWDFFVRVDDDGTGAGGIHECSEDDNVAALAGIACTLIL